jgi:hypothetical protein
MPAARPILFSAPMIRALLDGRKTQTRRIIKPQPRIDNMGNFCWNGSNYGQSESGVPRSASLTEWRDKKGNSKCPYGRPGDLLWVRETHSLGGNNLVAYRADGRCGCIYDTGEGYLGLMPHGMILEKGIPYIEGLKQWGLSKYGGKWKPSIHMPRRYSRLTLEITDVRVQRLHDITQEAAIAEGLEKRYWPGHSDPVPPTMAFKEVWENINGLTSWLQNPWVWALTFKVHKCNVGALITQKAA